MGQVALWRRVIAELLGSAFLAAIVVGSGIAAQQLSPGATGVELLENAIATGAGLFAIILMFASVSGAHFNPVVSLVDASFGGFSEAAISISTHHRATGPHLLSEGIATIGLLLVIFSLARTGRSAITPAAVAAYITAAYCFCSSTSFANPAITIGRMVSNTFAGIAPSSVPAFVVAQLLGATVALVLIRALFPGLTATEAEEIFTPSYESGAS